jgi:1-deoxy-D-xylulose-5-phosphate synthase
MQDRTPPPTPIRSPSELKGMSLSDLHALADDLRQEIVSTCLKNGGHLGASLGTVDLALALHYCFDSPREPIVWDVGHQAYAHKLLTGRWDRFHTLRQTGGISGFLGREESEHDVFGAGHSSTALSAALAMSYARGRGQAGAPSWTVAVVGDGGLTAGIALEAMNNARGAMGGPLLVVLNDNQMSISQNVGALPHIFAAGRTRELFELFGFDYAGPVDGHDLATLIGTLQSLRANGTDRPILLHVLTQKGKGYAPAEESPATYHGISPVLKAPEKVPGAAAPTPKQTFSEAFGEALCAIAAADDRVIAITAAMPEGTGLTEFARRFPDRFFDVGIAEPHAVTFAAGLATQGYKPVVAIYSTFLQRGLDQIIHDVALQNLGVVFALDRAGLVGADGPTHHGVFDLAYLGVIPRMNLSAPACLDDLRTELKTAIDSKKPWAIRYPRGSGSVRLEAEVEGTGPGEGIRWHQKASGLASAVVVALGACASRAAAAAREVDPKATQVSAVSVVRAKPIPAELVETLRAHPQAALLVVEDGAARGGFGESLLRELGPRSGKIELAGYADEFIPHGSPAALEELAGVSSSALASRLRKLV